jgi:hypothetical protein
MKRFVSKLFAPRFTLRAMFVVVTLVACWCGWNFNQVNRRARVQHDIAWRGAQILSPAFYARRNNITKPATPEMPALWRLMGSTPLGAIRLPDNEFNEDDRKRIQSLFPEAVVTLEQYPLGSRRRKHATPR